jgi:hypothetical protein
MARVILFGGGDGGGLIFGPNGVRPIPPFDPGLLKQIKAVAYLTQALQIGRTSTGRELGALTTKLANTVIGELEGVVGPLDKEGALVFQDEDGGFTCGSTGKPPIPFPWPPSRHFGVDDLLSGGIIERELFDVLSQGKVDVKALLADPQGAATKAGVKLSSRSIEQLSQLSPAQTAKIQDADAREVAGFFHKVVEDGRFLDTWALRPHEVSSSLGVKLTDGAIDRIVAGSAAFRPSGGGEAMNPVALAVAVGIVIMLVTRDANAIPISDRSGLQKF